MEWTKYTDLSTDEKLRIIRSMQQNTGHGLMDCQCALSKYDGDVIKAESYLLSDEWSRGKLITYRDENGFICPKPEKVETISDERKFELTKLLREESRFGMMDCKIALTEANWDYDKALQIVITRCNKKFNDAK